MSESGIEHHELSNDDDQPIPAQARDRKSDAAETTKPESDIENPIPNLLMAREELSTKMERVSHLSLDLSGLLSDLTREVQASMDQLEQLQSAVDVKKRELKTLYEIEASVATLERLMREQEAERENFERLMENQRSIWEEEKALHEQEEKEYLEALKARRKEEEEKYKHIWAVEHLKAQQELEEELRITQQRNVEKQKALESDIQDRDRRLQEKELEWGRLIGELEQYMERLAERAQSESALATDLHKRAALSDTDLPPSSANHTYPYPEEPLPLDKDSDSRQAPDDLSSDSFFRSAFLEEPKPLLSSLKDILQAQGRKMENGQGDLSLKRDCNTLKFSPKKNSNSKTEE